MKKIRMFLLMAIVMTMSLGVMANDDDRVITYQQLPQSAQTFLKQHFAKKVPLVQRAPGPRENMQSRKRHLSPPTSP